MKAIILNSGIGSRLGDITKHKHKSMVEIRGGVSLIYNQINILRNAGIKKIIITTGYMEKILKEYVIETFKDLQFSFIYNPNYLSTNYIYSLYLALQEIDEDIILMHGDLYFDDIILNKLIQSDKSCVIVDSTIPLPKKDFKANINDNRVEKIAIYIEGKESVACQPIYKLKLEDWKIWSNAISKFCKNGEVRVYAEEALNIVLKEIDLKPVDLKGRLCMEIDTVDDLKLLKSKLIN